MSAVPGLALAQGFPTRPIRLIVPFAPGGSTDVAARIIAEAVGSVLGQSLVVENRAGANGATASVEVARAEPDGHTVLIASASTHGVNPAVARALPFDATGSFEAVALTGISPLVLVASPRLGVSDLAGLLALLRREPNRHSYASAGLGSITHLAGELFKLRAGLSDIVHVPYRGGGPAMQAVVGGEVAFTVESLASAAQLMIGRQVTAIGLAAAARSPSFPDVATLQEAGLAGVEVSTWNILLAPKGTPDMVVTRLAQATNETVRRPDVAARLRAVGTEPVTTSTPASTAEFLAAEIAKFRAIVRDAGIALID